MAWVAPTARLASRRDVAGSMAMMMEAPAIRAPCTTDWPTPPQPMTATDEPGVTCAVFRAAPRPVVTPQPSRASCSSGSEVVTETTDASSTTISSANVPQPHTAVAHWPSASSNLGVLETTGPRTQWFEQPLRHHQQLPHAGDTEARTRSPTATRLTSGPTCSTVPHASWPGTRGRGRVDRPSMTVTSVWQMPLAAIRTRTSRGPTEGTGRSSMTSGCPTSNATATFTCGELLPPPGGGDTLPRRDRRRIE